MTTTVSEPEAPVPAADPLPAIPEYEVVRLLGRGGMGAVYLGRDTRLGREVAIKTLFAGADPTLAERFQAEVAAVAAIRHPNVLPVHHAGEADGRPYMVMEYVAGGTLGQYLAGKPISARDATRLLEPIARAVHHCHEHGILHRDLKPGNILLSGDRGQESGVRSDAETLTADSCPLTPLVADFGLAKRLDGVGGMTRTGDILGTPAYMAPEQASGVVRELGPGVDIYALGAILYEMLTGRPPFQSPDPLNALMMVISMDPIPPGRLVPRLPRDVETICLKCLQKSPKKRYASAAELADDLRRFQDGRPIVARPVPVWETAAKWARRKPALAALMVLSALGAVGLVVGILLIERKNRDLRDTNTALQKSKAETASQLLVALGAIHQMLIRLADDLVTVPGATPARERVLADAETFCRAVIRRNADDPGGREFAALARLRLGDVYMSQGRLPEAADAYRDARDGYGELVAEHPDTAAWHLQLLAIHNQMGLLHERESDPAAARAEYEAALAEGQFAAGEPEAARLIGRVRNNLALILSRAGELDRAETEHRTNLAERGRAVDAAPTDDEAAADLAVTHQNLGGLLTKREQWAAALGEFLESERLFAGLVRPRPADRSALGQVRMNLAIMAERDGQVEVAQRAVTAAADTLIALAADFPTPVHRELAGVARLRLARRLGLDGQQTRADDQLRAARDLFAALVKEFPGRNNYVAQLNLCRSLLGETPPKK